MADDIRIGELVTQSMLYSFEHCPRQFKYQYVERLKGKVKTQSEQPLVRGTWFHKLLEEYYSGRSWRDAHEEMTRQYDQLLDEEKDALGALPAEMSALMYAYLWHYGADEDDAYHGWIVHETERIIQCEWPGGGTFQLKTDMIVETPYGLYMVDHKTHKALPDARYRLLDKQRVFYIWAAHQVGIPVNGFIWNYIVPKAPTKPKLLKNGDRLSKVAISTDYPTMLGAIHEYGLAEEDYADQLAGLKRLRWEYGAVQRSEFFRRDVLARDKALEDRVIGAAIRTVERLRSYEYDDLTERTIGRNCSWCRYGDLCTTDLSCGMASDQAQNIRRQNYRIGDPLSYYRNESEV